MQQGAKLMQNARKTLISNQRKVFYVRLIVHGELSKDVGEKIITRARIKSGKKSNIGNQFLINDNHVSLK